MRYTSYNIQLRVYEAVNIFSPPMGTRIKAKDGQKIILFCDVRILGNKLIHWFWERNKKLYSINSTLDEDPRILSVSFLKKELITSYVCEVHNEVSKDMLKFQIVPYNEDEIVVNPSGALFIGMTITLVCPTRDSEDTVHVQWKKHDRLLDKTYPELTIVLKSRLDSGFYYCQHGGGSYVTYLFILDKSLEL